MIRAIWNVSAALFVLAVLTALTWSVIGLWIFPLLIIWFTVAYIKEKIDEKLSGDGESQSNT